VDAATPRAVGRSLRCAMTPGVVAEILRHLATHLPTEASPAEKGEIKAILALTPTLAPANRSADLTAAAASSAAARENEGDEDEGTSQAGGALSEPSSAQRSPRWAQRPGSEVPGLSEVPRPLPPARACGEPTPLGATSDASDSTPNGAGSPEKTPAANRPKVSLGSAFFDAESTAGSDALQQAFIAPRSTPGAGLDLPGSI
jgi:hypothetical protein